MSRLRNAFRDAANADRSALVVYVTHGDPSCAATADIVAAAAGAGADVIELGIPFSDPNADGPVIQEAMQRALANGGSVTSALDAVRTVRARGCEVAIVLFGYFNPFFVYGLERFAADAASAGVDGVLVVDLPIDELAEMHKPLAKRGLDVVPLVAPTSGIARIKRVHEFQPPFVYYISMTGVTGASFERAEIDAARVREIQDAAAAPVAVGFGVKSVADAARVAKTADGVVVGSAIVERIRSASPGQEAANVAALVAELRLAVSQK